MIEMGEMETPTVSVVVPNYNHARFLHRRLDSVFAQTYQDFEVILLDDCSRDESRAILREYAARPGVHLVENGTNSGSVFRQWNKGVGLARGKYVWIAESDDYADPHLLERLIEVLDPDPQIVVAYCRSWGVREDGRPNEFVYFGPDAKNPRWESNFVVEGREECRSYFPWYNPIRNASSAVFRKAVYEAAGRADESFLVAGDWKLWASMALLGKMAYVSEPLNYQQFHTANTQSKTEPVIVIREILDVLRWLFGRVTPSEQARQTALDWVAGYWAPLLMSPRVPASQKRRLLQSLRAVDPRPFRRALRPVVTTMRLKVGRHWRDLRSIIGGPSGAADASGR
jgi:glycosyltransferase involved in cell wall biosynthesis